jgi:putative ABC transport system permease protein
LKLCWKNVWRSKRRSLLTINAIGIGVGFLVLIHNYYDAFHETVIQNAVKYQSGHLQIEAPGYHHHAAQNLFIADPSQVESWIEKNPETKAWGERVVVRGLLSSPRSSSNIMFVGVDPEREKTITDFHNRLVAGKYLDAADKKEAVIGKSLAELLNVEVGSKIVALTQGVDGSIGNELFRVAGIFDTQSDADKVVVFLKTSEARALAGLPPAAVHQISVLLKHDTFLSETRKAFIAAFPPQIAKVEALTWMEAQRQVMGMIELNKGVNNLLMIIILCVAALGIANSILMGVMERTRECAVMMAIGTTKREVIGMVVIETLFLAIVGVTFGNLLGMAATSYFTKYGFDLKWFSNQDLVINGTLMQTVSYPTIHLYNCVTVTAVILGLSLLVSIIPARYISRMTVVKALRAI